ncbi:DUF2007 domain-containing protein, partial [Dysosmobacter welbionis]
LHFSALFVSVYPSAGRWDRGWIDGWIRINKIRLIGFNITWVGFSEVKASDSSRSRHRFFRGLEVGKFEVCTSDLRQSGRLRDCSGGKPLDIYLGWLPL